MIDDIFVFNLHPRFTGVSATIKALLPKQRLIEPVSLVDLGSLESDHKASFLDICLMGWSNPHKGHYRIWHARRDFDLILGIFFRDVLRQKWKLIFTSAANRRPGLILSFLINKCDQVIATSERSRAFLGMQATIINHGVDTDFFVPCLDKNQALANLGVYSKYAIGTFGRIRPSKGTDLFVDSALKLLPLYPEYTAIVIGLCQKKYLEYFLSLKVKIANASLEDRFIFLDQITQDQLRLWYQAVSIYVAPSRQEGFGLTPLEAMSCGTVVVTSDQGIWKDVVPLSGGEVFTSLDIISVTRSLNVVMSRPSSFASLGRRARDFIQQNFSIYREAEKIHNLYDLTRYKL